MLDLAAAAAGEVTAKERLEHEHERIPTIASKPLGGYMPEHRDQLADGNAHRRTPFFRASSARQIATSGK